MARKSFIKHSEEEKEAAFNKGKYSAIKNGTVVNLIDEGQVFLSDIEFGEIMGWNSQVFNDENKKLREAKRNQG